MSTHGLQWFAACVNTTSLDALANDWKADILRIAMYVQEQGYETDPAGFTPGEHPRRPGRARACTPSSTSTR